MLSSVVLLIGVASQPSAHSVLNSNTTLHGIIDKPIVTETDWWLVIPTILAALTSAAVAIFTYRLARQTAALAQQRKGMADQTRRVADETAALAHETLDSVKIARTGATLADQHHQESQSPVIVIKGLRLVYNRSTFEAANAEMTLYGEIWNVGFGPALQLFITVDPQGGRSSQPLRIGTVEIGQFRRADANFSIVFSRDAVPELPQSPPANVTISYQNIFGGRRSTIYVLGSVAPSQSPVLSETISVQEIVSRLQ